MKAKAYGKHLTTSLIILFASLIILDSSLFRKWEYFLLGIRMDMRTHATEQIVDPVVWQVRFNGDDWATVYEIVVELKRLGVRAVLIQNFSGFHPEYVDSTAKTGIAVFGALPTTRILGVSFGQLTQIADMKLIVDEPPLISRHTWGVNGLRYDEDGIARRFVPFDCEVWEKGYTIPDVIIPILGKYHKYPDSLKPRWIGDRIRYGDFEIPVMNDGSTHIVQANTKHRHHWIEIVDSLRFIPRFMGEWNPSMLRDKIVILNGAASGARIESTLRNNFVVAIVPPMKAALVFIIVLLSVFVATRYESGRILGILTGLALVYFLVTIALFVWVGFLMDTVVTTLTTLFCAVIFSYQRRSDEKKLLTDEKRRLEMELTTAREMQMGLMPSSDPVLPGYDISGICKPADEVGGDYFDYVWLNDSKTKLGIAVADVSGKAMKAAITAVMTSGMVYREVGTNETPKGILRKINRPIYLKTDRRIFTAMSFAVIDIKTKRMAFSNAGQMQPLLRRGGKIQTLKVDGAHLPLGMAEDVEYKESALQLRKADMIVFFTDGVPEAMNAKNEMFGFERLEAIVKESSQDLSAKQLAAKIVEKVAEFAGAAKQHDDMTVVVVRVL